MKTTITFDHDIILTQRDELIHAMLELTAPSSLPDDRAPLDIALVIDRSGSMKGEPLAAVRRAVNDLLRIAGPDDRIAVITFDNDVRLELPLSRNDSLVAQRTISNIHSGGSTNLSGGWLKGCEVLQSAVPVAGRKPAIQRIVVLTDGHANLGVTDPDQLCTMTRNAVAQGITTSLIGFANGYDEQLLAAMADAGTGNDYWCAGPDQAVQVFNQEFDGLAQVVVQNLSVEIRPTDATAAFEVLNEYDSSEITGVLGARQISIGDACGDELRRLVVRFTLRPRILPGEFTIANATIRWASTTGSVELHEITVPITVQATNDVAEIAEIDGRVMLQVALLQVAAQRRQAIECARHREFDKAREIINAAVATLTAWNADPLEIEELIRFAEDIQFLSERDIKAQWSSQRSTTKGRLRRFDL